MQTNLRLEEHHDKYQKETNAGIQDWHAVRTGLQDNLAHWMDASPCLFEVVLLTPGYPVEHFCGMNMGGSIPNTWDNNYIIYLLCVTCCDDRSLCLCLNLLWRTTCDKSPAKIATFVGPAYYPLTNIA